MKCFSGVYLKDHINVFLSDGVNSMNRNLEVHQSFHSLPFNIPCNFLFKVGCDVLGYRN